MSVRAIDSLINSHFLDQNQEGTTSYLFKDLKHRRKIEDVDELLNQLNQNDIGACVISIMEENFYPMVINMHPFLTYFQSFLKKNTLQQK